jgi:hypothetical protein
MTKKIFVHIGMHKTGSTSIQDMMYRNISLLKKHGISYPSLHSNHGRFLTEMFRLEPKNKKLSKQCSRYFDSLNAELSNPSITKIIFSAEILSIFNKEKLSRFYNWLSQFSTNIAIICCTRNPIDWYNSRTQQMLKARKKDLNALCESLCTNGTRSYSSLKAHLELFGKENMILYDFDKHKHHLCEKFLSCCAISPKLIHNILKHPPLVQNISLSHEGALILSSLNKLKPKNTKRITDTKETDLIEKIAGDKFKFSNAIMINILEKNSGAINWLAENFPNQCGDYPTWAKRINQDNCSASLFQANTLDSLATLLTDLVNENHKLKNSPLYALKVGIHSSLLHHIKQTISLRKFARTIREMFQHGAN